MVEKGESNGLEKGVSRRLHPTEIRDFIKLSCQLCDLELSVLALKLGIPEGTLQKIENAEAVDDATLEKLALVLEQDKGTFTKSRYVLTDQEAIEKIKFAIQRDGGV